jgi:hypothetical protein
MSDLDEKLTEIRERHKKDARWHCGPSMICPQSHEDRAFLLAEIERLRARVGDLTDALIDARFNGLIYWSPMTERGAVERAKMMARIDTVLNKEVKP